MKDIINSVTDEYLQDIERRIKLYEELDLKFKERWSDFEEKYRAEMSELETLREERNVKLDEVRRSLRNYAETKNDRQPTEIGEFRVVKKWSKYYNEDKLVEMLVAKGLFALAVGEGIVAKTVKVAKYDKVRAFLEKYEAVQEFECCEDGEDAGVAVFGPKSVPALGAELPRE